MTAPRADAGTIAAMLAERIEHLATTLTGAGPTSKSRNEVRFGRKGSLAVTISGPHEGHVADWESGFKGDALGFVSQRRRCDTREALRWARAWLNLREADRPGAKPQRPHEPDPKHATAELPWRIRAEATDARGTVVEAYLRSRRLTLPDHAPLRFHPACPRGAGRSLAMVALMTDPVTNEPLGVHRTFLMPDGTKARNPANLHQPVKAMLGPAGIIRLAPDEEVTLGLGIAEGIETSLSIMQHAGWAPVWAAGSAGAIAKFPVLDGIECLTIFADADDRGASLKAAHECAERWSEGGREARVLAPKQGTDWADYFGAADATWKKAPHDDRQS